MSVGKFIDNVMKEKGIKGIDLAEKCGVTPSYISKIRNEDDINPAPDVLKKISSSLNINYYDLLLKGGIIEKKILNHITHYNNVAGYLGEVLNSNTLDPENFKRFSEFVNDNISLLNNKLTKEIEENIRSSIGDVLFCPPVNYDSYEDYDEIPNKNNKISKYMTQKEFIIEENPPISQIMEFQISTASNGFIDNSLKFDMKFLQKNNLNYENMYWLTFSSPSYTSEKSLWYLIESNHYEDGNTVLFRKDNRYLIGKYCIEVFDTNISVSLITNIIDPFEKNYLKNVKERINNYEMLKEENPEELRELIKDEIKEIGTLNTTSENPIILNLKNELTKQVDIIGRVVLSIKTNNL